MNYLNNRRGKVLLVEDVEPTREFYSLLMQQAGFDVRCTGSAIEAISIVASEREPFDFILMNFLLPDMRGDVVIRELAEGDYNVKSVALFTSLDGSDPRVVRLHEDVRSLIDFHYVSKTPQCLKSYLLNPTVDSPEPIRSFDVTLSRQLADEQQMMQVKL